MKLSHVISLALALSVPAEAVLAHADLVGALPAHGAVVDSASQVTLTFSEAVSVAFSGIVLRDPAGAEIAIGAAEVDAAGTGLSVVLTGPLVAGEYRVEWHVLSEDGHTTAGQYTFSVK